MIVVPPVVRDVATLRARLHHARAGGGVVGLVPTLGALHAGHVSLIHAARHETDFVAVTVFVNPTQFNDPADLAAYPRDLAGDVAIAGHAGADLVFAPGTEEMYPAPPGTGGMDPAPPGTVGVDPGPLGDVLEGAARPGHFRGVATVVAKLFGAGAPCRAYFGEKDFQQAVIVRALARELLLPVEVVLCPTVREVDGLALSSRNARLSADERRVASVLYRALLEGRAALAARATAHEAEAVMAACVAAQPAVSLDYAVVRDEATLGAAAHRPRRLLIAARIGSVRLIDNIAAREGAATGFAEGATKGDNDRYGR